MVLRKAAIVATLWLGLGPSSAETIRVGLAFSSNAANSEQTRQLIDGFELGLRRSARMLGGRDVAISMLPPGNGTDQARIEEFVKAQAPQVLLIDAGVSGNNALLKSLSDQGIIVMIPDTGPADLAGKRCLANVFVTGAQLDQSIDTIAAHADTAHSRRMVLVHADGLEARAEKMGRAIKGEILRKIALPRDLGSYGAEITRLLLDKPQAIVLVAGPEQAGPFLTALRATDGGAAPVVLWPSGTEESVIAAMGGVASGMLVPGGWASTLDNPANIEFVTSFEQAFGRTPTTLAVYAYDAVRFLDVALVKTPEPMTQVALRDALHASALDSPRGVVSFANNNFPIQDFYIKRVEAGGQGSVRTLPVTKIFGQFGDDYAADCPMR